MKQTLEQAAIQFEQDYVKSDSILTDAQKFEAGANWQKQQANIQWFEIAKDGLPPIPETGNCTDSLLIWKEGRSITQSSYYEADAGFFSHAFGNWQPTHWAYFNLPKPE
jgi:hypothetical protein